MHTVLKFPTTSGHSGTQNSFLSFSFTSVMLLQARMGLLYSLYAVEPVSLLQAIHGHHWGTRHAWSTCSFLDYDMENWEHLVKRHTYIRETCGSCLHMAGGSPEQYATLCVILVGGGSGRIWEGHVGWGKGGIWEMVLVGGVVFVEVNVGESRSISGQMPCWLEGRHVWWEMHTYTSSS